MVKVEIFHIDLCKVKYLTIDGNPLQKEKEEEERKKEKKRKP